VDIILGGRLDFQILCVSVGSVVKVGVVNIFYQARWTDEKPLKDSYVEMQDEKLNSLINFNILRLRQGDYHDKQA